MDDFEGYCRAVDRLNRAERRARFRQELADGLRVIAAAKAAGFQVKGATIAGLTCSLARGRQRGPRKNRRASPCSEPGPIQSGKWCCKEMPKPKYWGVEPNRNRHGRLRWYFRPDRTKPRIRLSDNFGSPEFELAYRAAVAGDPLPASQSLPRQGRRASRGSLGWLVTLYLASPAFLGNRASTQRPRRTMLEKLGLSKGQVDVEDIARDVIQESMNARRETVHMANAWLATVSRMFEWATQERSTRRRAESVSA